MTCDNCRARFDTFMTQAICPQCGKQFERTSCIHCGQQFPYQQWRGGPVPNAFPVMPPGTRPFIPVNMYPPTPPAPPPATSFESSKFFP